MFSWVLKIDLLEGGKLNLLGNRVGRHRHTSEKVRITVSMDVSILKKALQRLPSARPSSLVLERITPVICCDG